MSEPRAAADRETAPCPARADDGLRALRVRAQALVDAVDRAARLAGSAAEHPEALSIRAEANRLRAALAETAGDEGVCCCEGYPPEVGGALHRPDCPIHAGDEGAEVAACGRDAGTRPDWMSPWQYDPCLCVRPVGHEGDCGCADHDKPSDAVATSRAAGGGPDA